MQGYSSGDFGPIKKFKAHILTLHELAINNDVHELTCLLDLRKSQGVQVDINEVNKDFHYGKTSLHLAAQFNVGSSHYEMAEILLSNGADPNVKDKDGNTPLWYMVHNSASVKILNLFLKFKADFTVTDSFGNSLLESATRNCNNLALVKFLVEEVGLDVNHCDNNGETPLHCAAYHNRIDRHYEILEYLLKMGADANARSKDGFTPLWELVKYGNLKVVDLFLSHNADLHTVCNFGRNVLFAFEGDNCDLQVFEKLICDFHLNVNQSDNDDRTLLHQITSLSRYDTLSNFKMVKCLLKNGANLNIPDKNGLTPMIEAVRYIREEDDECFLKNMDFFNFLIDQTYFSFVYNYKTHIFNYHYSYEDLEDNEDGEDQPHSKYLWKRILEHLAKLKFLSTPIHQIVLQFIEILSNYKDYFEKCTKELEAMKNTKPQNSWINFINLLVDSRRKIKNYAGNQYLIRDFESNDWSQKFPIYGSSMNKKMEKGIRRRKLFDQASILLSDCIPVFNPNHLIVKDILDCILSKKVLIKFGGN